jgi:hypothetical protein
MLTESQRIALDRREYQQAIAQEMERIRCQPIPLSMVSQGKHLAEIKLASLRRQLELATPEERPHVEEEIAEYTRTLARCTAELAARSDDLNVPEDPPEADRPTASEDVSEANIETVVPEPIGPTRRELRSHRFGILKAYKEKRHVDTMDTLARHLGVSRYGDDRLNLVLQKLGCTRDHWDNPSAPTPPK